MYNRYWLDMQMPKQFTQFDFCQYISRITQQITKRRHTDKVTKQSHMHISVVPLNLIVKMWDINFCEYNKRYTISA